MAQETKQPSEYKLIAWEMEDALASGESLVSSNSNGSMSIVVTDEDSVDVTSSVIISGPTINGTKVQAMTSGSYGADGDVFDMKWLITMSDDQIAEEDITLVIVEEKG